MLDTKALALIWLSSEVDKYIPPSEAEVKEPQNLFVLQATFAVYPSLRIEFFRVRKNGWISADRPIRSGKLVDGHTFLH
jgi:hypothetical protein